MSISANLLQAVGARDIYAVRDCLAACIVFDMNMTKGFPESLKYCIDHGIGESNLYEPHDGRPLPGEATEDNFTELCGQLSTNFSKERLNAIRRIGRILYPPQPEAVEGGTPGTSDAFNTHGLKRLATICTLAAVGVAVGGVVGGLLFRKAVVGAIAGGVAGVTAGAIVGTGKRTNPTR